MIRSHWFLFLQDQGVLERHREVGDGRYDICLLPRENKYPGIIMELKWKSGLNENVMKLGIAFSGKKVVIKGE